MKKIVTSSLITILFLIGFVASNEIEKDSTSNELIHKQSKEDEPITDIPKSISEIQDITELRKALNNTIWTHTAYGDQWLRYEFIGNTIKQYSASPKYGKWIYDGESQFTLSEQRTHYEGRKYFVATFMPRTESLAMFELEVKFNFDNYHLYLNGQNMGGFVKADYEFN